MSKLINISDNTYRKLKMLKGEEQSFTIIIENLLNKEESNREKVISFVGKGGIDEKRVEEAIKFTRKWKIKSA